MDIGSTISINISKMIFLLLGATDGSVAVLYRKLSRSQMV